MTNQQGVQSVNFEDRRLKLSERFAIDIEDLKQQFLYFEKRLADHYIFN